MRPACLHTDRSDLKPKNSEVSFGVATTVDLVDVVRHVRRMRMDGVGLRKNPGSVKRTRLDQSVRFLPNLLSMR